MKSFALELNVNVVKMISTSTDDLQTLGLVDAVKLWQPVEQLRLEPSRTARHSIIIYNTENTQ